MTIAIYHDDFHNTARIEKGRGPAYYKGPVCDKYRLILSADYDNNEIYYVSTYETKADAEHKLSTFSCGTFRK